MATATVSLDVDYLKSKLGLLRIGEALIGLCGIICEAMGGYCGYQDMHRFYTFVVVASLVLGLLVFIIYSLRINTLFPSANCVFLSTFISDVLFAILYLIATILMIVTIGACSYRQLARIFATLFGACGTVVVGLLAVLGYQDMRANVAKSDPA